MPVPAPIDTTMVMFFDGITLRLRRRVEPKRRKRKREQSAATAPDEPWPYLPDEAAP